MGFDPATMAIGALVLSAGSSIAGGVAENSQKQEEAKQYQRNAELARIGANQEEVARRDDLLSTLSSIRAINTSRGLDVTSPTSMAIADRTTTLAERGIGATQLTGRNQSQAYRAQAGISRSQGTTSLLAGFLKAGSTVAGGPGGKGWA